MVELRKFQLISSWIAMFAMGIFIVFSSLAMIVYNAGTMDNPDTAYDFIHNFFSDLGRLTTFSGGSNFLSFLFFVIALGGAGLLLIPYIITYPTIFQQSQKARIWSTVGSVIGIISALCYIGIAATPYDLTLLGHIIFVDVGFFALLPMSLCFICAIFIDKHYPRVFLYLYLCFCLILVAYLWLLFFGPSARTETGRIIQAVGQKAIVYSMVCNFFIQAWGTRRIILRQRSSQIPD